MRLEIGDYIVDQNENIFRIDKLEGTISYGTEFKYLYLSRLVGKISHSDVEEDSILLEKNLDDVWYVDPDDMYNKLSDHHKIILNKLLTFQ